MLLNNQHLGMVVQWEDRFFTGQPGPYLSRRGLEEEPYPDFVHIAKGFNVNGKSIYAKGDFDAALEEMLDSDGPYVLDVHGALSGTCAADDSERHDRSRHHQGLSFVKIAPEVMIAGMTRNDPNSDGTDLPDGDRR